MFVHNTCELSSFFRSKDFLFSHSQSFASCLHTYTHTHTRTCTHSKIFKYLSHHLFLLCSFSLESVDGEATHFCLFRSCYVLCCHAHCDEPHTNLPDPPCPRFPCCDVLLRAALPTALRCVTMETPPQEQCINPVPKLNRGTSCEGQTQL